MCLTCTTFANTESSSVSGLPSEVVELRLDCMSKYCHSLAFSQRGWIVGFGDLNEELICGSLLRVFKHSRAQALSPSLPVSVAVSHLDTSLNCIQFMTASQNRCGFSMNES